MLGKCANPVCPALFRKLGRGKLFAFESVTRSKSADITPATKRSKTDRSPVFFWLCEICSLAFTLVSDGAGQPVLRRATDDARVTEVNGAA
jgi:hypothetical protein